jgi:hypothetical protein
MSMESIRANNSIPGIASGMGAALVATKRLRAFATLIGFQLFCAASALAQTVPPEGPAPGGPASPVGTTGGGWAWIWILVVIVLLAAAIWYGTKRRRG